MVNPKDLHGKKIAMIAWAKTEAGEDDVTVFTGNGRWESNQLTMIRDPIESSFTIPEELLPRLAPVEEDLKEILLDADYKFSVSVGSLPENEAGNFVKTGLKWSE